jgi:ubiquinol-cytochrome c reductase cytochrome c1 subunit
MRKVVFVILLQLVSLFVVAGENSVTLESADVDIGNVDSLQRGARSFVNYCLSCHSASYMRFSRVAKDLNLSDKVVSKNLMFVTDKIGNTMQVTMLGKDAEAWFGVAPPDLSVIARSRGVDWLYTFLNSFYLDPGRPMGVNNLLFKDIAMPHVLWELQGLQKPMVAEDGEQIEGLNLDSPGRLTEQEYHNTVRDLVAFLAYMGEPAKLIRYRVGGWVVTFLVFLTVIFYFLKKEYWKDVH